MRELIRVTELWPGDLDGRWNVCVSRLSGQSSVRFTSRLSLCVQLYRSRLCVQPSTTGGQSSRHDRRTRESHFGREGCHRKYRERLPKEDKRSDLSREQWRVEGALRESSEIRERYRQSGVIKGERSYRAGVRRRMGLWVVRWVGDPFIDE